MPDEEALVGQATAKAPVIKPTVGRMVYYKLSASEAQDVNRRREGFDAQAGHWPATAQRHIGNPVSENDIFPAVIIRVGENGEDTVNLKVLLDGSDNLWVKNAYQGQEGGQWDWMPFQKDQQARLAPGTANASHPAA